MKKKKNDKYCAHVSVKSPLIGGHEVEEYCIRQQKKKNHDLNGSKVTIF